jgi:hypothetical protein
LHLARVIPLHYVPFRHLRPLPGRQKALILR